MKNKLINKSMPRLTEVPDLADLCNSDVTHLVGSLNRFDSKLGKSNDKKKKITIKGYDSKVGKQGENFCEQIVNYESYYSFKKFMIQPFNSNYINLDPKTTCFYRAYYSLCDSMPKLRWFNDKYTKFVNSIWNKGVCIQEVLENLKDKDFSVYILDTLKTSKGTYIIMKNLTPKNEKHGFLYLDHDQDWRPRPHWLPVYKPTSYKQTLYKIDLKYACKYYETIESPEEVKAGNNNNHEKANEEEQQEHVILQNQDHATSSNCDYTLTEVVIPEILLSEEEQQFVKQIVTPHNEWMKNQTYGPGSVCTARDEVAQHKEIPEENRLEDDHDMIATNECYKPEEPNLQETGCLDLIFKFKSDKKSVKKGVTQYYGKGMPVTNDKVIWYTDRAEKPLNNLIPCYVKSGLYYRYLSWNETVCYEIGNWDFLKPNRENYYYFIPQLTSHKDHRYHIDGSINLYAIDKVIKNGNVYAYEIIEKNKEMVTVLFKKTCREVVGFFQRKTKIQVRWKYDSKPNKIKLPDHDKTLRTITYNTMMKVVPDGLVSTLRQIRQQEAVEPDLRILSSVDEIAKFVVEHNRFIESKFLYKKAFAFKDLRPEKSCVSCGQLPEIKYKWKHRICNNCNISLRNKGYVTEAGRQIQQDMTTNTVYPGIVWRRSMTYEPPKNKMKSVLTDDKYFVVDRTRFDYIEKNGKIKKIYKKLTLDDLDYYRNSEDSNWGCALYGIAISGCYPSTDASNDFNRLSSIFGRIYRKPRFSPEPGIWIFMLNFVDQILPNFSNNKMEPLEWLATMPKNRYESLSKSVDEYLLGYDAKSVKSGSFDAFIKMELLPAFNQNTLVEESTLLRYIGPKGLCVTPVVERLPRLIQGPKGIAHVTVGKKTKPLMSRLKEIWHWSSPLFYASCKPIYTHNWLNSRLAGSCHYFWCDYTQYENTHTTSTWDFIDYLYDTEFEEEDFKSVIHNWREPIGNMGRFKYRSRTALASGRDDTSLSNSLLNGFAMTLCLTASLYEVELLEVNPIMIAKFRSSCSIAVCGDDMLAGIKIPIKDVESFSTRVKDNISKLGFDAKFGLSDRLCDCVFLANRPYVNKNGIYWGRTIGRSIFKLGWRSEVVGDGMAWVTGVADAHVITSKGVPILYDLCSRICFLRQHMKRLPIVEDPSKPWLWQSGNVTQYDEKTLEWVVDVYNRPGRPTFNLEELKSCIREIYEIERIPCVIHNEVLQTIIALDDC